MEPTLRIKNLSLSFIAQDKTQIPVVKNVSLELAKGQALALVGESGSGKTLTADAIFCLLPKNCHKTSGEIYLCGEQISDYSWDQMTQIRGKKMGYIFQDPMASLNPTLSICKQIEESLKIHTKLTKFQRRERIIELLELVEISSPHTRLHDFPYQFSGGQRQRIMIALALSCNPKLLIADEPTTALDVTVQAQILLLLKKLQAQMGISLLIISHDLSIVWDIADSIHVMYAGEIVEEAKTADFFANPKHPYSRALISAIPTTTAPLHLPSPIPGSLPIRKHGTTQETACLFAARCPSAMQGCFKESPALYPQCARPSHKVRCFLEHPKAPQHLKFAAQASTSNHKQRIPNKKKAPVILKVDKLSLSYEKKPPLAFFKKTQPKTSFAIQSVSFELEKGKTLGLVGESGSGKSTLAKCLSRVLTPDSGEILLDGVPLDLTTNSKDYAKRVQMIFQDPFSSLNPRLTLFQTLNEPLQLHDIGSQHTRCLRIEELLHCVGLPQSALDCYPHQFSGGQKQRIGIARALAVEPEIIIADEPVSSLDVSTQAQIIQLLVDLQEQFGLSYLFIGHDLSLIRLISDKIAVMKDGKMVEIAESNTLFNKPIHPYTQALIASIPRTRSF